jgi:hypothetical protein
MWFARFAGTAVLTLVTLAAVAPPARAQNVFPCNGVNILGQTIIGCQVPKGQGVSPTFTLNVGPGVVPANGQVVQTTPVYLSFGVDNATGNIVSAYEPGTVFYTLQGFQVAPANNLLSGIVVLNDPDAGIIPSGCNAAIPNQSILNFGANTQPGNSGFQLDTLNQTTVVMPVTFALPLPTSGQQFLSVSGNIVPVSQCGTDSDLDSSANFTFIGGSPSTPEQQEALSQLAARLEVIALCYALQASLSDDPQPLLTQSIVYVADALQALLAAAVDPPDLNFTTIVTPTPLSVNLSGLPPAATQAMQTATQLYGYANAVYVTVNRSSGAILSGDMNSFQNQLNALPTFEGQVNTLAAQLPAQLTAAGRELVEMGINPASITEAQVAVFQQNIQSNGLPANYISEMNTLGIDSNSQTQIATLLAGVDPNATAAALQNILNIGALSPPALSAANNVPQVSAVLPASRSAVVGSPVTAFATIINTGSTTATGCVIAPTLSLPVNFEFQTTNPATNALTGTLNAPVNIAPGAAQSFVIAVTPTASLPTVDFDFSFFCANANAAPITSGLNTLLLSASTTPVPDIVALAASGDPGIVDVSPTTNAGVFAVATVNLGSGDQITATTDTNGTTLPVAINICQTVPATGACLNGSMPSASVTTQINVGSTPTFGIFVSGTGASIPFDPANNRVFVRFTDSTSTVRGATSVAVRTQ